MRGGEGVLMVSRSPEETHETPHISFFKYINEYKCIQYLDLLWSTPIFGAQTCNLINLTAELRPRSCRSSCSSADFAQHLTWGDINSVQVMADWWGVGESQVLGWSGLPWQSGLWRHHGSTGNWSVSGRPGPKTPPKTRKNAAEVLVPGGVICYI